MSSGALGHGSYRSVIAGTKRRHIPMFHPTAFEMIELYKAHRDVLQCFAVRDKIFDNKFPSNEMANGLFKMFPPRRQEFHNRDVTEAIRRRTLWAKRIQRQRMINSAILQRASQELTPQEMQKRFSYRTADSDVYFKPLAYKTANIYPNWWQHPTLAHVVPKPRWRRVPELDNITRVDDPIITPQTDY